MTGISPELHDLGEVSLCPTKKKKQRSIFCKLNEGGSFEEDDLNHHFAVRNIAFHQTDL